LSTPGPTGSTCCWIQSGFYLPVKAWKVRIRSCLVHYELVQADIATMRSIAATSGRAFHDADDCHAFVASLRAGCAHVRMRLIGFCVIGENADISNDRKMRTFLLHYDTGTFPP
jgi:hypothetical protein